MEKPRPRRVRTRLVVPSRTDAFLRPFVELVGGPLGARTAPGVVTPGFFTVDRVLIILTTLSALVALLLKSHCLSSGWSSPDYFYATCYSDFSALFQRSLSNPDALPVLSQGVAFEYPVLLGLLASLTTFLVPGEGLDAGRTLGYFGVNAVLATAVWIAVVVITAKLARRRAWDAAMVALAPGIIVAGFINWDIWAVGMLAMAMLCFARKKLIWCGIWIGLGAAFKLFPILFLGALLLAAMRTGKFRGFVVPALSAAGIWLAVSLPVLLLNPVAHRSFFDFSQERGAGFSSIWYAYNLIAGRASFDPLPATTVSTAWLILFALLCLVIAVLALSAPRRPRLAQLAFLIVAAFLISSKVYSPQFVLWLIPLYVLARPRWGEFLLWQLVEVLHWAATWMYLGQMVSGGSANNNMDMTVYLAAIAAHVVVVLYLMVRVVRDMFAPEQDLVRAGGIDDPQGGIFDHAPDRFRFLPTLTRTDSTQ